MNKTLLAITLSVALAACGQQAKVDVPQNIPEKLPEQIHDVSASEPVAASEIQSGKVSQELSDDIDVSNEAEELVSLQRFYFKRLEQSLESLHALSKADSLEAYVKSLEQQKALLLKQEEQLKVFGSGLNGQRAIKRFESYKLEFDKEVIALDKTIAYAKDFASKPVEEQKVFVKDAVSQAANDYSINQVYLSVKQKNIDWNDKLFKSYDQPEEALTMIDQTGADIDVLIGNLKEHEKLYTGVALEKYQAMEKQAVEELTAYKARLEKYRQETVKESEKVKP